MNRSLILFLLLIPVLLNAQYTYFNQAYQPAFPEVGIGDASNLICRGDSLMAYAFVPMPGQNGRRVLVVNGEGVMVSDLLFPEGDDYHVVGFSEAIFPLSEGGYFWSGSNGGWPIMLRLDDNFAMIQRIEYQEMFTDSSRAGFFKSAEFGNGDIVSDGRYVHIYGPMPGELFSNLILARHDTLGNELWFREYTLSDLNITIDYGGPFAFPAGGLFELSNGDILVFGSIGNPHDCYAIKFDSVGNYLDHVKWGHAQYGDGSAWPVRIGVDEFAFGYSVFSHITNDNYIFGRPRIGWLSAGTMELTLGNFFDHPHYYGGVFDMERAPDGGFVMFGKANQNTIVGPGSAFLLKVNSQGQEEWYQTYLPPETDFHTPSGYDLEMTPDGGMAFVGNYFSYEAMNYVTWIVKTDACGELVFNGCGPQVGVEEKTDLPNELRIYPNPANDIVQINWTCEASALVLYSTLGQQALRESVSPWQDALAVDLSALPSGLYVLKLLDASNRPIASVSVVKE